MLVELVPQWALLFYCTDANLGLAWEEDWEKPLPLAPDYGWLGMRQCFRSPLSAVVHKALKIPSTSLQTVMVPH